MHQYQDTEPVIQATVVWDFPLRVFHWLLVACLCALFISANLGASALGVHILIGQFVLVLLVFRVIWGFVGSHHARFLNFVVGPNTIKQYLSGSKQLDYSYSSGHNPLGALSVLVMLALLSLQVLTGLFASDDISHTGPLNFLTYGDWEKRLTNAHHLNFLFVLGIILLHLAAVFYYQFKQKADIIRPMWHGWKPATQDCRFSFALAGRGLAVLLLSCAIVLGTLQLLQLLK